MRKLTDRAALKGWTTALLAVIALAAPLVAENPDTAVKRSHDRAKQILDAAVEAIGGRAAVDGVRAVRITLNGRIDSAPSESQRTASVHAGLVPGRGRARSGAEPSRLDDDEQGWRLSREQPHRRHRRHRTELRSAQSNVTPIAAAGAQNQLAVYQRRLPSLILRTALQRAATLRYLGEDTVGGAKHHVITFVHQDPCRCRCTSTRRRISSASTK